MPVSRLGKDKDKEREKKQVYITDDGYISMRAKYHPVLFILYDVAKRGGYTGNIITFTQDLFNHLALEYLEHGFDKELASYARELKKKEYEAKLEHSTLITGLSSLLDLAIVVALLKEVMK